MRKIHKFYDHGMVCAHCQARLLWHIDGQWVTIEQIGTRVKRIEAGAQQPYPHLHVAVPAGASTDAMMINLGRS